jgi:hypothetical protein
MNLLKALHTVILSIQSLFDNLPRDQVYLDPGSGSFILQLILAALLGSLFILKGYWKKLVRFFQDLFSHDHNDEQE